MMHMKRKKHILTLAIFSGLLLTACQNQTNSIEDFESCITAGNPVMESFPEQCSNGTNSYTKDYTGAFCGGIAAFPCPAGFECLYDGNYPDAGGTCQKP